MREVWEPARPYCFSSVSSSAPVDVGDANTVSSIDNVLLSATFTNNSSALTVTIKDGGSANAGTNAPGVNFIVYVPANSSTVLSWGEAGIRFTGQLTIQPSATLDSAMIGLAR